MGIFNYDEFNKKEKPVFTGSKFGFGSGPSGPTGPFVFAASGGTKQTGVSTPDGTFTIHTFLSSGQFEIQTADAAKQLDILIVGGGAPGDIPHGGQIQGGAAQAGISTRAFVGAGATFVGLSTTPGDKEFVSFFVHYNGGTNTDLKSYKVYVTKNGGFNQGSVGV